MKQIFVAAALSAFLTPAFALTGDSDAKAWNRASRAEKVEWVGRAVDAINARQSYKFTHGEIIACIDALFVPPVPKGVASLTLGEGAAGCMLTIKNQ